MVGGGRFFFGAATSTEWWWEHTSHNIDHKNALSLLDKCFWHNFIATVPAGGLIGLFNTIYKTQNE